MSRYVPESAIDYAAVFQRGGRNLGDEDFALFKCPLCSHVYLMEYEVDTVYLSGDDLTQRADATDPNAELLCLNCGSPIPKGAWVGPRAEERFQVTWEELRSSAWAWVENKPGQLTQ